MRFIGLAVIVPMAFTSPAIQTKGAATAPLASRPSESFEIKQQPDLLQDGQPEPNGPPASNGQSDKKAGVRHYVMGMTLSFNTSIQNPVVHVVLAKKDDRSQTYSLEIDSPEPITFAENESLSMDQP